MFGKEDDGSIGLQQIVLSMLLDMEEGTGEDMGVDKKVGKEGVRRRIRIELA